MKKFVSRFFLVLICCMMCIIPFESKPAKAAAIDASEIVYFQSIVKTNVEGSFAAITAVSQRYYKSSASLGQENTIENSVGTKAAFTSVHEESVCSMFSSDLVGLCDAGKLNGPLADLKMTKNGDISLTLATDVKIGNLRIYYITAGRSGEAQLFCTQENGGYQVCEKANTVYNKNNVNNKSNWKNYSKSGEMVYSATTIEGPFTKSVTSSGKTTYTEFNLFKQMNPTYEEYAENSGVYVVISFSVIYSGVTYYVNDYTLDSKTFTSIGDMSNSKETQLIRINGPTQKNLVDNVTSVTKNAALVKVSSSLSPDGSKGFNTINGEFKDWMVPVIAIVIGIMFVVSGTMTGVTIVKSSDEPEVRRDAIKRLIGLFIGALAVYLILFFYEDIIKVISGFFE